MKRCIPLFIFLLSGCFGTKGFAQLPIEDPRYPDSLLRIVRSVTTDTAKAMIFFRISDHYRRIKGDSARGMAYVKQGLALAGQSRLYRGIGHVVLGNVYFDNHIMEKWPKSQKEYMLADSLLHDLKTPLALNYNAAAWYNYALIESMKGNDKSCAQIMINKVIPIELQVDSPKAASTCTSAGLTFMYNGDDRKALEYFAKSKAIYRQLKTKPVTQADPYIFSAEISARNKDYATSRSQLDSAFRLLPADYPVISHLKYNYGEAVFHNAVGQYDRAISYANKGLSLSKILNRDTYNTTLMFEKAVAYKGRKDYAIAKKMMLDIYNARKNGYGVADDVEVLMNLAQIDSAQGNLAEAYHWLMALKVTNDSIYKQKNMTEINELELRYQTSEKEKQILSLQADKRQQQLVLQKTRLVTSLLLAGIIFVLVILFFVFKLYRSRQLAARQERSLHEQQIVDLEQKQQLKVYDAILQGQEEERNRMARDLHDGLGGMLASVKINLTNALPEKISAEMERVIGQLDRSAAELRRIARNMMPEALLRYGLETALTELCEAIENDRLAVDFKFIDLQPDLPRQTQLIIYRIAQELLANVVKHAAATEVFLQCSQHGHVIYLTVEDNGRGLVLQDGQAMKGLGFENIKSRVSFLKGKIDISGQPGRGTIINIELNTN